MGKFDDMQKVCLSRGIIYPSAEIYPTIAGFFDYGNTGAMLKRKFIEHWRDFFVRRESGFTLLETDGCVMLPESVFVASGHVGNFTDPISQCKKCKNVFRADHLIEESSKKFVEGKSAPELDDMIKSDGIRCPKCGGELGETRVFNLMFRTEISPLGGQPAYLRPETAQNIFSGFQRIYKTSRAKLPFGVYQIGHSFRNEISPRQFIIRLREFSQCEIELFFDPEKPGCPIGGVLEKKFLFLSREAQKNGEEAVWLEVKSAKDACIFPNEWILYYLAGVFEFYKTLGIPEDCLRIRHLMPEETPHYSSGNYDLEVKYDFGWKETVSNSCRNDHDLKSHSKNSGTDLSITTDDGRKIMPNVVEPSFGLERTVSAILYHSFRQDSARGWDWFSFPPKLSPYSCGIFPLVGKDGLPEKAGVIFRELKKDFDVFYDEKGSIGKRYARADEIGTPFCVTVDYQTMDNSTVTIRNRDTAKQERVEISKIKEFLKHSMTL